MTNKKDKISKPLTDMNAVIYTRVSSEEQKKNFSLLNQEEICKKEAERQGLKVLKIFKEEGKSAKNLNRPRLIELLEYCRKNKDNIHTLFVYRIDRLSRQTTDYLIIKKKLHELGIRIFSVNEPVGDSPVDKFVETLLAGVAQLDNDTKGERAKQGLHQRFKAGLPTGRAILGYQNKDKKIYPHPVDFEKVKKAWLLMGTGTKSTRQMTKIMNAQGLRTVWGGKKRKLRQQQVNRIFRNSAYCGILKYKRYPGEEVKGNYKSMISKKTFYKVQVLLDGKRTTPVGRKRVVDNEDFPLRNLLVCECGSGFTAAWCKGRSKHYPYYWCGDRNHKMKFVRVEKMEEMLNINLKKLEPAPEAVDLFLAILKENYGKRIGKLEKRRKTADTEIKDLKGQLKELVKKDMKGEYPKEILEEVKTELEDKLLAARIVKNENLIDQYDLEAISSFIKALFKNLAKAYEVSDYGQRQVLIGSIYPQGILFSKGKLLNRNISPIFRDISGVKVPVDSLGAGSGNRTRILRLET